MKYSQHELKRSKVQVKLAIYVVNLVYDSNESGKTQLMLNKLVRSLN